MRVRILEALSDEEIDNRLGLAVHLKAADEGAVTSEVRSRGEWTVWVLAVVLLAFLGEMVLAWVCGRSW